MCCSACAGSAITGLNDELSKGGHILDLMHGGASGSSASYEAKDGHIVTTIDGTPFNLTVFQTGDKQIAARSNEFGHANYELAEVAK